MTLLQWFEKGMTFQLYVDSMNVNKEELQYIFDQVKVEEQLAQKLEDLKTKNWKVVTLTADWCGDALLCVPIVQKMMEIAQIETRFLNRDDNLELMDQYLTNGTSRSIPIFIFMDQDGNEMKVWGPRSSEVEAFVAEKKKDIPHKEDPDFQAKQIVVFKEIRSTFMKESLFWDSVMKSVEEKLFS
ncbi:thioredoxin family protein [Bacillus sp. RG28]|uniref:Thioredoxin family protein n=1 Tax=Gottfriedia endophytica TaxID=2820819 RepID=A0A940NPL4_9BACI|nr:thioredoxin family protein [Gottfriedia endophytica]MBP0725400.1 thioredoxin family protein [Gottfriedia endophytica]